MSSIFRRSNLPSWLGGDVAPPQAPQDPQVRKWMKSGAWAKKETAPVARMIEKALARKPDTLDLSSASPRLLEHLPVSLLLRLRGPTHTLVLAQDCPPGIALRLMQEIGARHLEPKSLMQTVEQALSPRPVSKPVSRRLKTPAAAAASIRGGNAPAGNKPRAHRDEPIYDVPPRRDEPIYDVPPRRAEPIYDVPPRRGEQALDRRPRPDSGGYETPASLFAERSAAANRAGLASGRRSGPGRDYVVADRPAGAEVPSDPIYVNQPAAEALPHRQRKPIDGSPLPSPLSRSSKEIDAALQALRTLRAWSRGHAANEGPDPRCAMSASDANALAKALRLVSATDLRAHERLSWLAATVVLAKRQSGASLHVTQEAVSHLEIALDAVQRLAADAGAPPPALPPRRRQADGG